MAGDRGDLVVVDTIHDWACAGCGTGGRGFMRKDDAGEFCLDCADLGHLVYLPRGDAALTRRARKHSTLSAVVVRFSRSRRRYERQGSLVEEAALEQAEAECLADADVRARRAERDQERRADQDVEFQERFADAIVQMYPGCPSERAVAIARHAGERGSGRVGRSAAGRDLDDDAVTLAVRASVRHVDTRYDDLLMAGTSRDEARAEVADDIGRLLDRWRA